MHDVEVEEGAARPGRVLACAILERVAVADADDKALEKTLFLKARPRIELDALHREVAPELENEALVADADARGGPVPVAQENGLDIFVPEHGLGVAALLPAPPNQRLHPASALLEARRQVDRRVQLLRLDEVRIDLQGFDVTVLGRFHRPPIELHKLHPLGQFRPRQRRPADPINRQRIRAASQASEDEHKSDTGL